MVTGTAQYSDNKNMHVCWALGTGYLEATDELISQNVTSDSTVEFFAMEFECEARRDETREREMKKSTTNNGISELSTLDKRCVYGAWLKHACRFGFALSLSLSLHLFVFSSFVHFFLSCSTLNSTQLCIYLSPSLPCAPGIFVSTCTSSEPHIFLNHLQQWCCRCGSQLIHRICSFRKQNKLVHTDTHTHNMHSAFGIRTSDRKTTTKKERKK